MQTVLLDWWLTSYLQLGCLCVQFGFHSFMERWYESEIRYLDKRIAKLEQELSTLSNPSSET